MILSLSTAVAASDAITGSGSVSTIFWGGSAGLERVGGRIFEMGGNTDFGFTSLGSPSGFLDRRSSSIREILSGRAGIAAGTFCGSDAAEGGDSGSEGCLARLIGGTPDLCGGLDSTSGFFLRGEIRSVACAGAGAAGLTAGGSAFVDLGVGSFLLLARVAMNLSL
jgi:hypothetical protein